MRAIIIFFSEANYWIRASTDCSIDTLNCTARGSINGCFVRCLLRGINGYSGERDKVHQTSTGADLKQQTGENLNVCFQKFCLQRKWQSSRRRCRKSDNHPQKDFSPNLAINEIGSIELYSSCVFRYIKTKYKHLMIFVNLHIWFFDIHFPTLALAFLI